MRTFPYKFGAVLLAVGLIAAARAPAWAADPGDAVSTPEQDDHLERKLDGHGRAGSKQERKLKSKRAAEKAKLIEARKWEKRNEVIIIGSSSVKGALGRRLAAGLERDGFKATRWGRSASGLSRLDYYDWFDAITDLPIGDKTAGVIVYVGVNDPQGIWLYPHERKTRDKWVRWHKPEWHTIYRERVTMLINALCALGVPKVAMLTPVDVRWESLQERLIRVRRLQIEGARRSKCGVAVSGSGDLIHLQDPIERRESRRARDGYHLTGLGGDVVWDRIQYRVTRLFRGKRWLQVPEVEDVRVTEQRRIKARQKRSPKTSATGARRAHRRANAGFGSDRRAAATP